MCHGEGFSTSSQRCAVGKTTEVNEVRACLQRSAAPGEELLDACGCKPSEGEGWSTTRGKCAKGSDTAPEEACDCQRRGGRSALVQKDALVEISDTFAPVAASMSQRASGVT